MRENAGSARSLDRRRPDVDDDDPLPGEQPGRLMDERYVSAAIPVRAV